MGPGRLPGTCTYHGSVGIREGTLRAILNKVAIGPYNLKARS